MKSEAEKLTLRQCFETFNLPDLTNPHTAAEYRVCLNRWEKYSDDPAVGKIGNRTLANFRDACIDAGLSPATFNGTRNVIRLILRRIGPAEYRNPQGEGLIPKVPFVKKLPEEWSFPRIWTLEELGAMYDACNVARRPEGEIPAADWWRTLLVFGFHYCPRRRDLLGLRTDAICWKEGVVRWAAKKTRKWHVLPLVHPACVSHVRRVWSDREFLFPDRHGRRLTIAAWQGHHGLCQTFRRIQQAAGLPDYHGLHTLRKSGSSYLESVAPDMAPYVLGHSLTGVTARHYINPSTTGRLAEALRSQPQPSAFLRILDDGESKSILRRRTPARATEWEFSVSSATWKETATIAFRGCRGGRLLRCLQLLVCARRPLTHDDFDGLLFWEGETSRTRVKTVLWGLRQKLKDALPLPPMFDPIPFVDGGYILRLP